MQKAIHLQIIKITFFTIHSTLSVHLPDIDNSSTTCSSEDMALVLLSRRENTPIIFENTLSYVNLVDSLSLSTVNLKLTLYQINHIVCIRHALLGPVAIWYAFSACI